MLTPFDLYDLNGGGGANELFLKSTRKTVLSFYGK